VRRPTRALDVIGHAPDRAEDRVDRDVADDLVGRLVAVGGDVAGTAADGQRHLERAALGEGGDLMVGIEDLELSGDVDVGCHHLAGLSLKSRT
jgi:hypothetical protein